MLGDEHSTIAVVDDHASKPRSANHESRRAISRSCIIADGGA
jgi:hypothetical protein